MLCFRCQFEKCLCSFYKDFALDVAVANMSFLWQNAMFFHVFWLALFWKTTSKHVADDTRKRLENRANINEKSSPKRSKFEAFLRPLRRRLSGTIWGPFSARFWEPLGDFWRPESVQDDVREKTEN